MMLYRYRFSRLLFLLSVFALYILIRLETTVHHPGWVQGKNAVDSIAFMKTHKTGSGTMCNILLRYGLKRNWNLALRKDGEQFGNCHTPFRAEMTYGTPWRKMVEKQGGYNLFCNHGHWNYEEVQKIMKKGTLYVTS